ncbi:cytochrome P450 [Bradyrhizobium sp. sGM-13]|uniref:cytochrome P450 n=1 Tax=Bradyrhizobium sp. sGM-13 TaxID=2831781 RepID=UPI001BCC13A5|nr:cytochrome P450 [Bradyrhizobium sp. sGM-13]
MISNVSKPLSQGFTQNRPALGASLAARFVQSALLALRLRRYRIFCCALSHLWFLKVAFAILRRVRPLMIFKKTLFVTKASDVREVLDRFEDFTLGDSIAPGMPWGAFLMTVDWTDQHAAERQLLQSVVAPLPDVERIRAIVAARCREQIDAAPGEIDVVADLFEPVVVSIASNYFGVPPPGGRERGMAKIMRDLAGIIMVNPPVGSKPWIQSRDSIAVITSHVSAELERKAASLKTADAVLPDDLLTRLLRQLRTGSRHAWFDEDWIRRYMTGLLATGAATIVRAAAHTVDQLLAHPDALNQARAAARELERQEDLKRHNLDENLDARVEQARCALRHYIYEALRFRPMLPLLLRDTPRETVIASGTKRARLIPAGTRVIAPPLAAMFDPEVFPEPSHFLASRPLESYLHFGQGPRQCFGRYIAETALMEIVRALLLLPDLVRKPGASGRLAYEGPAASSMIVTFSKVRAIS